MAQFNHQKKELTAKLVYYGTALGGKTTNLQFIHRSANPDRKVELYSLNTMQDRTLFFDLLPLSLGRIRGYALKLQLYTVPGQPQYQSTRKVVLAGADAVVFVADSSRTKLEDNVESLGDFKENLTANGIDLASIPIVMQYNKRDLPDAVPQEVLNQQLNPGNLPCFLSVATVGTGVLETFMEASKRMVLSVTQRYQMGIEQIGGKSLLAHVDDALRQLLNVPAAPGRAASGEERTPPRGIPVLQRPRPPDEDTGFRYVVDSRDLLESSVKTSLTLAQLYAQVRETKNQLEKRVKELQILNQLSLAIISTLDLEKVLQLTLTLSMELLGVDYGSLSMFEEEAATLREMMLAGMEQERLNIPSRPGEMPLSYALMMKERPLLATGVDNEDIFQAVARKEANLQAFIAAPLRIKGKPLGVMCLYSTDPEKRLGDSDLQGIELLANQASVAIENARLYTRLESFNVELERKVRERTAELEAANAQLRRLDELKSNFLAIVSHELRTPLTSIRAFAEILMDESGEDSTSRARFLAIIQKETERLTRLIDDILDLSKLEAGKMQWKMKPFVIEEVIREAIQASSPIAETKKLRITFNADGPIPHVYGDWDRIFQVVFNLIGNAVKFNRVGGEVALKVEHYLNEVTISVADTGIGIREDNLTRIFDKFHQVDATSSRERGGIGLGLAICGEIIRHHGGRIWVTSVEGQGSTFYFTLPSHQPSIPAETEPVSAEGRLA
ncbi:MAG: ATP-binding protein [Acidobacteriota bacterium]